MPGKGGRLDILFSGAAGEIPMLPLSASPRQRMVFWNIN